MTKQYGRYWSPRDFNLVHSINSELLNDIIQSLVSIYKLSSETKTNIYGESSSETGKQYFPPYINIESLIEFSDSSNKDEGFGPDKDFPVKFKFNERFMQQKNIYPEEGDIISWDNLYFEIFNTIQEQYIGGQSDKQMSIICETHLTKISNLNIINRGRI